MFKLKKKSLSIRFGLRQVKRPSSNPKSERYFWLNPDFIEGNLKHKKRRTNSCESILRFGDCERSRTFNRWSRNPVLYPIELRSQSVLGHQFLFDQCRNGFAIGFSS